MSKKMLFNEPSGMLGSVLSGQKTMTRRLGGLKAVNVNPDDWGYIGNGSKGQYLFENKKTGKIIFCNPHYNVGDIVYVGEAYAIDDKPEVHYKLDVDEPAKGQIKWKNPMFMPESAARCFLKIKSVRVGRMAEISNEDCIKEGIEKSIDENTEIQVYNYPTAYQCSSHKEAFGKLIDFVNKKEIWKLNLWNFVYEFEKVENPAKTEKP